MASGAQPTVLILGGTGDAVALAKAVAAVFGEKIRLITSLAGRTKAPTLPPGDIRVGGFGGAEGLARYLRQENVTAVIDATHPFAAQMTANAVAACEAAGVPRLRLDRPAWTPQPGDNWHQVADLAEAAAALPGLGARALLTVGSSELRWFRDVRGVALWARMIELPGSEDLPPGCTVIRARGPFTEEGEQALLRGHDIDLLVTKNSGGDAASAKLAAARALSIPVVMVARPPDPPGDRAAGIDEAVAWLRPRVS